MTFEEYEKRYATLYADYAKVIRFILERAIAGAEGIPQPQSIQSREKDPASLKRKLIDRGILESEEIETEIKDLAGVRLIFYTNTDVDRFLSSRVIQENFAVDYAATKIHHPIKENEGLRYQAIHYIAGLSDERLALAAYTKFRGLRCEFQIQTVLNHAWSETSHDIIYKDKSGTGFGSKATASIRARFDRIMDKYLLPAGYEFQRVQQDYERLLQGKALFDRDALQTLRDAKNNNERHDLLITLRDRVLPNYDDILGIYRDVATTLVDVAKRARTTPVEPIKTVFGSYDGKTSGEVIKVALDIFVMLRYVDVERTFLSFCELSESGIDSESEKHLLNAAKQLARYDLEVWRQVGPQIQLTLMKVVGDFGPERRGPLRPLLIAVWVEALASDLSGASWSAEAITWSRGALPVSVELEMVREAALSGLFDAFEKSITDAQRSEVVLALRRATFVPTSVPYSDEFLKMSLADAKKIVGFLARHSRQQSYEMLEKIEHDFLDDYHRARALVVEDSDRRGCRAIAQELMSSIEAFRDSINDNDQFVRYKTLVGFEAVFPPSWKDDDFEYDGADKYRRDRVKTYVSEVSEVNEEEWFTLIERCAATKSDDLATFPIFRHFLCSLAQARPEIAGRLLKRASDDLLNFLASFLDGLAISHSRKEYDDAVARIMDTPSRLVELAIHLRGAASTADATVVKLIGRAIAESNAVAVIQCLAFVIEKGEKAHHSIVSNVFDPALQYLIDQKDARWVRVAWFIKEGKPFFTACSAARIERVLESLAPLLRIEHHSERVLGWLADGNPKAVWTFFGHRLNSPQENDGIHFEAVPYRFHGLEKSLSRDASLGISIALGWYQADRKLFRYRGGRLLKAVFSTIPEAFVQELTRMASSITEEDIDFIYGVLANFEGEVALHTILQELVDRLPEKDEKLLEIEYILENTGMVSGAFGFVETYRRKKDEVTSWLDDPRSRVKAFASSYCHKLDQLIASEQRRAEQNREQRKRDFPDDDGN